MPHVAIVHHRQAAYGHAEAATVDLSEQAAQSAEWLMKQGFIPHVRQLTARGSREFLEQPVGKDDDSKPAPNEEPNMVLISLEHAKGQFVKLVAHNVAGPDGIPAKLEVLLVAQLENKFEDAKAWLVAKQ